MRQSGLRGRALVVTALREEVGELRARRRAAAQVLLQKVDQRGEMHGVDLIGRLSIDPSAAQMNRSEKPLWFRGSIDPSPKKIAEAIPGSRGSRGDLRAEGDLRPDALEREADRGRWVLRELLVRDRRKGLLLVKAVQTGDDAFISHWLQDHASPLTTLHAHYDQ